MQATNSSYSFNKINNNNNNVKIKYIRLGNKSPPKYPSIYANTKNRNRGNEISSSTYIKQNTTKNNKNKNSSFISSSCDFFERNYNKYILKQQKQVKQNINKTMSNQTLNALLFKLKKYYNDILTNNKDKKDQINLLKSSLKHEEFKLDQIINFQDIELPDEKISVKNFKEIKLTRDEVQQKLIDLNNENQNMKNFIKNVTDYTKTVEFMFEDEKVKLINIKKETNYVLEQLNNIKQYQRIIDYNLKHQINGEIYMSQLDDKLNTNNEIVSKVNNENYERIKKLNEEIEYKEMKIQDLQEKLEILKNKKIDSDIISENEYKAKKIKQIKENIHENKKKEKKYIEIIYCLSILQKYFINSNFFDLKKLYNTKDYKILLNKDNLIINNNDHNKNDEQKKFKTCENFNKKISLSNEIVQENGKTSPKTDRKIEYKKGHDKNENINSKSNRIVNINTLLEKFNELTITKDNLMNYNSKIISELNFYKKSLNDFHNKEIKFETQKVTYKKKLKSIISENYQLFESFSNLDVNNTEKFLEVIKSNNQFISETKRKTDKKRLSQIKQKILKNNKDDNTQNSDLPSKDDIEQINLNSKFLYQSVNNTLNANKNFLFQCMDILKENINVEEKITKAEEATTEDNNTKENNIIEKLKIEYENIKNFLDSEENNVNYTKDRKKFLNYLIDLINFVEKDDKLKQLFNLEELNNNLLSVFYKDSNKKYINKFSFNLFMLKNIPIMQNIFRNFTTLLDSNINTIKSLIKFINDIEFSANTNLTTSSTIVKTKSIKNARLKALNSQMNKTRSYEVLPFNTKKNANNTFDELEYISKNDNDSINEEEIEKPKIKKKKKKVTSLDKKITKKLYEPFLEKITYLRHLNQNIKNIKNISSYNCKQNFIIQKKQGEANTTERKLLIYNNPLLNVDKLSNPTYNSLLNVVLSSKNKNSINYQ